MRVLNVMLASSSGGLEQAAVNWHKMLTNQGVECKTICHPDGMPAEQLPADEIEALKTFGNWNIFSQLSLRNAARAANIMLLHGNRPVYTARLSKHSRLSRVIMLHNFRFKQVYKKYDAAISVTSQIADAFSDRFPSISCHVVPNVVDVPLNPMPINSGGALKIGAIGRLHPVKGFDLLLNACAILRSQDVEFELKIAGDGPELESLVELARAYRIDQSVRFLGWVKDKRAFFEEVDVVVSPSRSEPFGISILEALAFARPVIAAETDGALTLVQNGYNGIIVGQEDPLRIAAALARFAGDMEAVHRYSINGWRSAQKYSFQAVSAKAVDTLAKVLSSRVPV